MADIADLANDQAEYLLQAALARTLTRATRASAEVCEDCDASIPPLRQRTIVGCQTCVGCQQLRERRK